MRWSVVPFLIAFAGWGGGVDGAPAAPSASQVRAALGQPAGIRVVDVGVDFLVWAWDPVETATGYEAQAFPRGTAPSERPPLQITVDPTFRADGLEPDTAMGFFVRAVLETAGGRATGPWSYLGTAKTLPPPAPPMTVAGTVRATGGPASVVAGAVVRATNLNTGAVDGETTADMDGSYAIRGLQGHRYSIDVMPPSGYLSVAALVNRPESGDLEVSADLSLHYYTLPEGTVTALPAGRLIYKSANFFDLEGKTVTFTPDGDGYAVAVDRLSWEQPEMAAFTHQLSGTAHGFTVVDLPFSFSFAGSTWNRLYANANGHISFQRPEQENWPERVPWADGTMRSLAAAIDSRSAAGLEAQIAALWAVYGNTTLSIDSTPTRVVVSWSATRPTPAFRFNAPLGANVFQARLYPSGQI